MEITLDTTMNACAGFKQMMRTDPKKILREKLLKAMAKKYGVLRSGACSLIIIFEPHCLLYYNLETGQYLYKRYLGGEQWMYFDSISSIFNSKNSPNHGLKQIPASDEHLLQILTQE